MGCATCSLEAGRGYATQKGLTFFEKEILPSFAIHLRKWPLIAR